MRQIELIRRSRIPTLALPASRAPANKPSPAHFPSPFPSSFALSPSFLCPSPFSVSYLHETTLHVAGLGGLDGGVDETLTTAHGVEEKLGRRHPRVEAVAHEPLGGRGLGCVRARNGRASVSSVERRTRARTRGGCCCGKARGRTADCKVRQGAVHEALRDAGTADDLLADTRNHLRDVDLGALGAALGHDQRRVVLVELVQADLTGIVTNLGQLARQLGLRMRARATEQPSKNI